MAISVCVAGVLSLSPLNALQACAIGAPYYAVLTEIMKADKMSPNIRIGTLISFAGPTFAPFGVAAGLLGSLAAPSYISWNKDWDYKLDEEYQIPWGLSDEKRK